MRLRVSLIATSLVLASVVAAGSASVAGAASASCASITKSLVVSDGYTMATGPVITPYNYAKASANAANALGTTIDFGPQALIVSCVSPSDIAKLSAQAGKKTMSATAYMNYMVSQSQGAMTKTPVGGVNDYLDFGNGKEDGLGSLSKAGSLRLDAWVAGNYIFLGFSQPASQTPSKSLLNFIKSTTTLF